MFKIPKEKTSTPATVLYILRSITNICTVGLKANAKFNMLDTWT